MLIGVVFVGNTALAPVLWEITGYAPATGNVVVQVFVLVCAQLRATLLHLLGLDFYNRPGMDVRARITDAVANSWELITIRMFRQGYISEFGSLGVKYFTVCLLDD